jgi:hypothetical protein
MTYAEIRQIAKTGNAECERRCPFLKNSADIGVGIMIDCDQSDGKPKKSTTNSWKN